MILICPDIHGREFWKPLLDYKGEIICLGDYLDPYPDENITYDTAYDYLVELIKFKKDNKDRVTLLLGNHCLHYLNSQYECWRFSHSDYKKFNRLYTDNLDLFQVAKQWNNVLFTHAGVNRGWYDEHKTTLDNVAGSTIEEQLNNAFKNGNMDMFSEVARYRGGWASYGSPMWADLREYAKKDYVPFDENIVQIVGHTQLDTETPSQINDIVCVDNRKLYLLDENDTLSYYPSETIVEK